MEKIEDKDLSEDEFDEKANDVAKCLARSVDPRFEYRDCDFALDKNGLEGYEYEYELT